MTVEHARVRLLGERAHAVNGFIVSVLPEKIMRAAECRLSHLERSRPAPAEITSIEAKHLNARLSLWS
jgi:hypothetical protein